MKRVLNMIKSKFLWVAVLAIAVAGNHAFAQDANVLKPEDIAKISDEAQKTLNGFAWTLEVAPSGVKKEDRKVTPDTLIFKDGKMSSEGLAKKGYGTSNYTLTVGDDGVPVFETMQRDEKEGVAFWRGELVEGKIRGVISIQEAKSPAVSFGFSGSKAGEAAEIPAERIEPQPEIVPETVTPVVDATPIVAADAAPSTTEATAVPTTDAAVIPTDVVAEVKETAAATLTEVAPSVPVVESPAPEVVQPEPVKPPKKKRGFFG